MTRFEFSQFGRKFTGGSGILQLMEDIGAAAGREGVIFLGGGNPSLIPAVEATFRTRMAAILDSENRFEQMVGTYDGPAGFTPFVDALVEFFNTEYDWGISPANVALTNGSQTAFFLLFNLLAGSFPDGSHKKILLPLAPEYIGYADVGIDDDLFVSYKPTIQFLDDRLYKYRVDFERLKVTDDIGAICVSRPTNPTGNVLTEGEIAQLSELAAAHNIPLIIDNAYGMPFPGIIYTDATPTWSPHIVMSMSLSKLGLPGARTGIIIAHEEIVAAITGMNAVISLAPGSFGANLALDALQTRQIMTLSREVIRPHYEAKAATAVALLREQLGDTPAFIHKPEGAFFLWLWFRDLPISCAELYERLKARNVLVIPGHHFFPGLADEWPHRHECIRMNYAAPPDQVERGITIIAEEVRRAWDEGVND